MSPISTHPDLDLIEDNEAKRNLLTSTMFWGTAGAVFGIHDEPDKFGSVNYLHPIDGTHAKYWIGFTITDLFWKVIEQILDDVVAKGEGEEPADLVFDDDEEFRQKRHYTSRANNPDSNVTCACCNVKFKNDESLKQHVSKKKNTKCSRLHRASGLPAKLEKRQEDAAKPHGCKHCSKRFLNTKQFAKPYLKSTH